MFSKLEENLLENASTQFPDLNPDDMQPTDICGRTEDKVSAAATSAEAIPVDTKPATSSPSIHLRNQSDLKNETGNQSDKQIELSDSSRKDEYKVLEVDFPEEDSGEDCDSVGQQEPSHFKIAGNALESETIAAEESVVCIDEDGDQDDTEDKDEIARSANTADETSVPDCDEISNINPIPVQSENDPKEAVAVNASEPDESELDQEDFRATPTSGEVAGSSTQGEKSSVKDTKAPSQPKSKAKDDKCGGNKDKTENLNLSTDLEEETEEALTEKQYCHSKVKTNKNDIQNVKYIQF